MSNNNLLLHVSLHNISNLRADLESLECLNCRLLNKRPRIVCDVNTNQYILRTICVTNNHIKTQGNQKI
jgi:hypothetical protein